MRPHYKLDAWKDSMRLVDRLYKLTRKFPADERFGLTSQIRRSAISIPSNLAEGAARYGSKEFAHFVNIAKGSLSELETQLLIANRLNYIGHDDVKALIGNLETISSQLHGLHQYLMKKF